MSVTTHRVDKPCTYCHLNMICTEQLWSCIRFRARPKTTATHAAAEEQPMDLLDLLEGGAA